MQITVSVSEEICREADVRGVAASTFVEELIERGFEDQHGSSKVSSAIERIRALRQASSATKAG